MDLSSLIPYLLNTYYTPSNLRIQCLCNHGLSILIQKQKFSHGDKFLEQNKGRQHWEMVKALQPAWLVLNHSFTSYVCAAGHVTSPPQASISPAPTYHLFHWGVVKVTYDNPQWGAAQRASGTCCYYRETGPASLRSNYQTREKLLMKSKTESAISMQNSFMIV